MFAPFERLGDTGTTTGVGLGLAVSRGLTEAMAGTLGPEQPPGGGLTMAISVPAVPGLAWQPRARTDRDLPDAERDHDGARAWHGAAVTVSRSPASRRSPACYAPCWPTGQCHSDSPGHAARAAGSDAGAPQTWSGPPGRPKPGVSRGTD